MKPSGDPLAGLRPLHSPLPVSWWPPAPGWWLLAGLVLLVLGLVFWWYRRTRVQRATLAELAALKRTIRDSGIRLTCLAVLLKRYARYCYPAVGIERLTGEAWLHFLDEHGGKGAFTSGPGRMMGSDLFRPGANADLESLQGLVRGWIRKNRRRT